VHEADDVPLDHEGEDSEGDEPRKKKKKKK